MDPLTPHSKTTPLMWFIALILACSQTVYCNGVVEVKALRYTSSCTDNWILRMQCDPYFQFCLKKSSSPSDSLSQCDYGSYGPTDDYDDQNNIDFSSTSTFAGGVSNPMRFELLRFQGSDLKLVIEVTDKEFWQSDEHKAWLTQVFQHVPAASVSSSTWTTFSASRGGYTFQFQFRSYCTADYYTSSCDVYCLAQDNTSGHYTCHQVTGAKVCLAGWEGDNCHIDVDECTQGTCRNGATCTNMLGSYFCSCPEHFTGTNCELMTSLCYSRPCWNGGTCVHLTHNEFKCTCPVDYQGPTCDQYLDMCQSSPCQNAGTCTRLAHDSFQCTCTEDYGGETCEKYIDPCLPRPCQNGGTCIRLDYRNYTCTCPVDYTGTVCDEYVDLCSSLPCLNSGTCVRREHDDYRCVCTNHYIGKNCSDKAEKVQDELLPVILGVCISCGIVVIIAIVIFIILRRNQIFFCKPREKVLSSPAYNNTIYQITAIQL